MNIGLKNELISKFMDNEQIKIVHKDKWGDLQWMTYLTPEYQKSYSKLFNVIEKLQEYGYQISIDTEKAVTSVDIKFELNVITGSSGNTLKLKNRLFDCIISAIQHYNKLQEEKKKIEEENRRKNV